MPSATLTLEPRDGFHFKDGRGWHSEVASHARAVDWPFPPTLLGALRTAWGRANEGEQTFTRDDWLSRTKPICLGANLPLRRRIGEAWRAGHRMWPRPADAWRPEGTSAATRLEPKPEDVAGQSLYSADDNPADRLWFASPDSQVKAAELPLWWTDAEWLAWLRGQAVEWPDERDLLSELPARRLPRRVQVHVGIDPETLTGRDGSLFSADVCETLHKARGDGRIAWYEWGIALEADTPESAAPLDGLPFTLGGDSRLARCLEGPQGVFAPPADFGPAAGGLRLFVVTPVWFEGGWLPDGFGAGGGGVLEGTLPGVAGRMILRAALVNRPLNLSGWDLVARGPKNTRRLVPPGAVYFFQKASGEAFTPQELAALWLAGWGQDTGSGLGRVVAGRWDPGD
ncbi:MAG: CRISPR-associated protein Crm3 [Candidatus Sericytochromatia bacterium]|nr:CRISPR-associated protein Crm3 [Candidatus Tanganyikabacteria bacterium]